MSFIALLDTDSIWSAAVRDTILRAAKKGLFRPAWTDQILDDLARTLLEKRPDLRLEQLTYLVSEMRRSFPEAIVEGYQDLISSMKNHEGDRHVLAAAVRVGAGVIVTNNAVHFPSHACEPYCIDVQSPDEFLCHLWHLSPETMVDLLHKQAASLIRPPRTVLELLETLGRTVPNFVSEASLIIG